MAARDREQAATCCLDGPSSPVQCQRYVAQPRPILRERRRGTLCFQVRDHVTRAFFRI